MVWLGVTDVAREGQWVGTNNSDPYLNWLLFQPDNGGQTWAQHGYNTGNEG